MSQKAEIERDRRRLYARPGGPHDRFVAVLKVAMPMAVGAFLTVMALAPLTKSNEWSFVLDKHDVALSSDRLRVSDALYRGQDDRGRPFALRAGNAVQTGGAVAPVRLTDLVASILLPDGPASIRAPVATYDLTREAVAVPGPLDFQAGGGYYLATRDVVAGLADHRLRSMGPVSGQTRLGTFTADTMAADLDTRTVDLTGHVRLRIVPGALR